MDSKATTKIKSQFSCDNKKMANAMISKSSNWKVKPNIEIQLSDVGRILGKYSLTSPWLSRKFEGIFSYHHHSY